MKILYFDTITDTPQIKYTGDNPEDWRRLVKADKITIEHREINKHLYTFILNPEEQHNRAARRSATDPDGMPVYYGALIVCNQNEKGAPASLNEDDIDDLIIQIRTAGEIPEQWLYIQGIE